MRVNGGMSSDIYFMYNYFLKKMDQAQNERKNYVWKVGVNSNFYFVFIFFLSFYYFFVFYDIKKYGQQIFIKKYLNSKSLTSTQGVTDKLKQIKQEKEEKKEEKKKREGNDEMKGIKGYPKVPPPFLTVVPNDAMQWASSPPQNSCLSFILFFCLFSLCVFVSFFSSL